MSANVMSPPMKGHHLPVPMKFLFASISGVCSTLILFPLEVLKNRMQVHGEGQSKGRRVSIIGTATHMVKTEGLLSLYSGMTASCLKQFVYTGTRLGLYDSLLDYAEENGFPPNLYTRCACGIIGGIAGATAGLPADVSLTRMAVDGRLPPDKQRKYKHVFNAIARMYREEGIRTLYRGLSAIVVRTAILTSSQLTSYSQMKEHLLYTNKMQDDIYCHMVCSLFSAFVASTCVLPADIAKTRMQNMKVINGKPEYSSLFDVWAKIVQKEGPFSLWKGWSALVLRNGPQFIVLFVTFESLKKLYRLTYMK